MGNIEIKDLKLIEKEDSWICQCKAVDRTHKFEVFGVAHQPKKMQLTSGGVKVDVFALPKVVSKAQRNALRSIIPETIVKKMMVKLLGEERVKSKIVRKTKGFKV